MKQVKNIVLALAAVVIIVVASGYAQSPSVHQKSDPVLVVDNSQNQTVNLFVTHGHCSTPFAGIVDDLKISTPVRDDLGNHLENMKISFEVDPSSFSVCRAEELTTRIRTPGLFIGENEEKITFTSTEVYTMGIDWYQVNGKISIKGVERDVKLFATGIRDPKETVTTSLVLEGQMNLLDWGIDYDLIVNGKSDPVPTKWMYINMKIDLT